jgi:hypothetical protein
MAILSLPGSSGVQGFPEKLPDGVSLGVKAVIKADIFDGASQRRLHQKLYAFGFLFVAHGAEHKSSAHPKQGA